MSLSIHPLGSAGPGPEDRSQETAGGGEGGRGATWELGKLGSWEGGLVMLKSARWEVRLEMARGHRGGTFG